MLTPTGRVGGASGSRVTAPGLFVVAVLARTLSTLGLALIPRDGTVFVHLADQVAAGRPAAALQSTQHPLYPLLAGAFGGGETVATAVAILAAGFGAVALVQIGARLGYRGVGVLAGVLYAVSPMLVRYQGAPLTEGLFIPLVLFSVERGLAAFDRRGAGFAAGLLCGAAYLTRPEGIAAALVIPVALAVRRRWLAAVFLVLGFVVVGGPYIGLLTSEAGTLRISRKKSAARFVSTGRRFEEHMAEKEKRTGLVRPGFGAAVVTTAKTYASSLSWVLLFLSVPGVVLLLRRREARTGALVLLALVGLGLFLRFRLLTLYGYLGVRHLLPAAALTLPFAGAGLAYFRRWTPLIAGLLAIALLIVSVEPRGAEKSPLKDAGAFVASRSAPKERRIATLFHPRIPYYARGENVPIEKLFPALGRGQSAPPDEVRRKLVERADWLAFVPARLAAPVRATLDAVAEGRRITKVGKGEWTVEVVRLR